MINKFSTEINQKSASPNPSLFPPFGRIKGGLIILLFLAAFQLQAQDKGKLTPMQQMDFYKTQIDSAEQEMNAGKMANAYGKIVSLCRENTSFESELPKNLYNYGMWSTYAGNHQTAIDALIELLDMPDNNNDDKSLFTLKAQANNALGMTYFFLKHWDNALVYYQKSRDMAVQLQNNQGLSVTENNIGNIYQKKGQYQQAIEHYLLCLQLQEELDDKETICNTYHNMATCYGELGNSTESLKNFHLALNMAKEIGDKEIEALSLIGLAQYYAKEKRQFAEALKLVAQAEEIAKETGFKQVLAEIYQTASSIHAEHGNFASALDYFKQYKALSDTLFNEQSTNQLNEHEVRYQTKEKELEIVRQQSEIQEYKTRQFIYIGSIIAALLLLTLLAYIVMMRSRRNRELTEMNAIKDKFFSIISHDLKNPALAQQEALKLLSENAKQWDENMLSNYYQQLLESANGLVELLKNLLNWAVIQTKREVYHPITFDLVSALQPDLNVIKNMTNRKNILFNLFLPQTAIVNGDENMLVTVIRNLLTNAVKFTAASGTVCLDIKERKDGIGYIVSVSDTGIGMANEHLQSLFRLDNQHLRRGTADKTGTGLGLIVCRDMLQKHGSTLHVESEEGKGSRFWFEIK